MNERQRLLADDTCTLTSKDKSDIAFIVSDYTITYYQMMVRLKSLDLDQYELLNFISGCKQLTFDYEVFKPALVAALSDDVQSFIDDQDHIIDQDLKKANMTLLWCTEKMNEIEARISIDSEVDLQSIDTEFWERATSDFIMQAEFTAWLFRKYGIKDIYYMLIIKAQDLMKYTQDYKLLCLKQLQELYTLGLSSGEQVL
tara:strand:- start:1152 stop:1751 length:600 start_codon:yes stop_codon:yes gene_type:complete